MSVYKDEILALTKARKSSDGFVGHCPAHDDKNPSLGIKFVDNLKNPLVYCFAGCSSREVIKAFKDHGLWIKGGRND